MKTSPTMVTVLLLLIAFGCFMTAPVTFAEGPWDRDDANGGGVSGGNTTGFGDGQDDGDGDAILRSSGDTGRDNESTLMLAIRTSLKYFLGYMEINQPALQTDRAGLGGVHDPAVVTTNSPHRAAGR